ncbi:hypothetical protein MARINON1_51705 [Marinobacter salarius]|nr:hypothetical protein MBHK15_111039 [Marinobacter salarius]VXB95518.1 hypothetical protein MARINON1_51705 [Marinobacter salarius]
MPNLVTRSLSWAICPLPKTMSVGVTRLKVSGIEKIVLDMDDVQLNTNYGVDPSVPMPLTLSNAHLLLC